VNNDSLKSERELLETVEGERRRIGEFLHDTLCQSLAGSALLLSRIEGEISNGKPVSAEALGILKRLLHTAVTQARALSQRFRPADLEGYGLMTALAQLTQEAPPGKAEFVCEKAVFVAEPEIALALFRIAEQALEMCVVLHSTAPTIQLRLEGQDGDITLAMHDPQDIWTKADGFPGAGPGVSGIALMELRARCAGGVLSVQRSERIGTSVVCRFCKG
jgi:signal transduction histidine kinase